MKWLLLLMLSGCAIASGESSKADVYINTYRGILVNEDPPEAIPVKEKK
jgi:hypothetical protein